MSLPIVGPHEGRVLVSRREAEPLLGYASHSLKVAMRTQSGWPEPVACRLQWRRLLWWLDELEARALPDDAEAVTCLECGRDFRMLGPHLFRTHEMTSDEYRAAHGLGALHPLASGATREALRVATVTRHEERPELLERMRAATPPLEVLVERSAVARAETAARPGVRNARARAARVVIADRHEARRQETLARLAEAGFSSVEAAVAGTRSLSASAAAARLGMSVSTVRRWRRQFPT